MTTQDYKYTADDLKQMQSWSLERKIQVTQAKIVEFYGRLNGKIYQSFSGGKDSTVALSLSRRCYPGIEAVFCDTGLELPDIRKFALSQRDVTIVKPVMRYDEVIDTYGWCFPNKDIAKTVYYARKGSKWALNNFNGVNKDGSVSKYKLRKYARWKFLIDSKFKISDKCCGVIKLEPLLKYERESGNKAIIATLADESYRRRSAWFKTGCNVFDSERIVSKPLSFWKETDILRYLHDYNVAYARVYGDIIEDKHGRLRTTGERHTGCCFCPVACHLEKPNKFQRLEVAEPKLYDYVMNKLNLRELLDFVGVNYGTDSKKFAELSKTSVT